VKKSGRDEPMWVAIHMCVEAMLGMSLYSYLYLRLAKMLVFLLSHIFSLQQNWRMRDGTDSAQKWGAGRGGPNVYIDMYTHICKCKNNKIK
jgi:hypothetical protein